MISLSDFADQINANGLRMLSRPHNFEKLMKDLLSVQTSALNLVADDTKSPICPYVCDGMNVVDVNDIRISGY